MIKRISSRQPISEALSKIPSTPEELVKALNEVKDILDDCWRGCNQIKGFKREAGKLDKIGTEVEKLVDSLTMRGY